MSSWHPDTFEKKKASLRARMSLIQSVRRFFDDQGFWEVETPILQIMPTADTHIHGFKTELKGHDLKPQGSLYLQTSPEFEMKKLLVAGVPSLYQICKSFRNAERSPLHRPEFTMLEWYRAQADYEQIMQDLKMLLCHCAQALDIKHYRTQNKTSDPFKDWSILSVAEAFERYAGIDLEPLLNDTPAFSQIAQSEGIRVIKTDRWDDIFHAIMAEKIEPHLGQGSPTILKDYPASMASLARRKPDAPQWAERFELYVCGVELANAFSELTDAQEQRARFQHDMKRKEELYGERYPLDEEFLNALEYGLPPCAGIALGIDRLVMLATGVGDIGDVLWAEA